MLKLVLQIMNTFVILHPPVSEGQKMRIRLFHWLRCSRYEIVMRSFTIRFCARATIENDNDNVRSDTQVTTKVNSRCC